MKLLFNFKHLDYSKSLELYTQEVVDKISFFLLKEEAGMVQFSKAKGDFIVEISIPSKQKYFKAVARHFDIYSAVDAVVEKLEKQLLKVNKINKHHKKVQLSKWGKLETLNSRFEVKAKYRKAA